MAQSTLSLRLINYFEVMYLLSMSAVMLPITILTHPLLLITNPSTFRSKWFENFWNMIGPKMAASPVQMDYIDSILSRAHGVVLELGPGSGDQMPHFRSGQISRMYGAEPNAFLHPKLVGNAKKNGLGGKYFPLVAGAQPGSLLPALKKAGLIPSNASNLPEGGIFDSIITVKSMCSAPQKQLPATVAIIQALLKPGGEFLFFEHLENDRDTISRAFTWIIDLVWPAFMGGCRLDGKLDKIVLGMGGWDQRDLETVKAYTGVEMFRYVKGVCRKA